MERIGLTVNLREQTGKCPNKRLRKAGRIPAVLYGKEMKDAISLSLDKKEREKVLHTGAGGNVLVDLNMESQKSTAMFKEIVHHPLKETIEHVDLVEVLMDKPIMVSIPVHVIGKAAGLAFGGVIQQEARKLRIECLPAAIPDAIDADVTPLGIGHSLHVKDLILPAGVSVVDDMSMTVVSVVAPTMEVAPKTAEEVDAELAKSFEVKEEAGKKEEVREEKKKEVKEEKKK